MTQEQDDLKRIQELIEEFEQNRTPESLQEAYLVLENVSLVGSQGEPVHTATRREVLSSWLELLKVLDQSIDRNFDADDVPSLTVEPPPSPDGSTLRPGVDPAKIEDPKARAEYKAAIAANNEKAINYSLQTKLLRLNTRITSLVEAFVLGNYTRSPVDQEELHSIIEGKNFSQERTDDLGRFVLGTGK